MGMILYKNNFTKSNYVSVEEIEKIENYINQIYMWKEITGKAIPDFENINQADETWLWEVVKKNTEEDEPSYEQIQEKAKEIFGPNFTKQFPKEGTKYLTYQEETKQYKATSVELDQLVDSFLFNTIEKTKEGYEVEIIEYLEDTSPMLKEETEDYVIIKNLDEEEIGRANGNTIQEEIELVKKNSNRFTKKKMILKNDQL